MRYVPAILCALAVAVAQGLYGGVLRPVFALPAFALVGLAGLVGAACFFRGKTPEPNFFGLSLVAMLAAWLLWREMNSPDAWLASGYFRLTLGCLVVYLLFACVITNPYHRLAFVSVLLLLAMIQVATAAWQFTHAHDAFPIPWQSEQLRQWYAPRFAQKAHGFFLNGNHLSWFLNAAGITALSLASWGRWGISAKVLCFYVALMSFAGSMLTGSRGGFVSLAAGLAVFFLLSTMVLTLGARDRRWAALLGVVTALVVTAGILGWLFDSSYFIQDRYSKLLADSYRTDVFAPVARQFQLAPLMGTGAGTFLYHVRQLREFFTSGDDVFAHNDWAQLAADFGFPALALLAAAVAVHFAAGLEFLASVLHKRMAASSRPQSHAAALLIAALACVTIFAVHSFFDFNMQIPANALLASAFFGMLANPGVEAIGSRGSHTGSFKRMTGYGMAGICGGWLLLAVGQVAWADYHLLKAENALLVGDWETGSRMARKGLAGGRPSPGLRLALGESLLLESLALENPRVRWSIYLAATKELSLAVDFAPQAHGSHALLARVLAKAGRLQVAEEEILEAIRLNPGANYEFYAELMERSGRLSEAARLYQLSQHYGNHHSGLKSFQNVERKRKERAEKNGVP